MAHWSEHPSALRHSLIKQALPSILYHDCPQYCIEGEADITDEQLQCVANCQTKTMKSFDLYMAVANRMAAKKNYRHYVDISKFTGMEVEHKHDTESVIPHLADGHYHPQASHGFQKHVGKLYSGLREQALQ
jgi:UDP-2,3-diacylglucosamine pyrophosphatase LpxH